MKATCQKNEVSSWKEHYTHTNQIPQRLISAPCQVQGFLRHIYLTMWSLNHQTRTWCANTFTLLEIQRTLWYLIIFSGQAFHHRGMGRGNFLLNYSLKEMVGSLRWENYTFSLISAIFRLFCSLILFDSCKLSKALSSHPSPPPKHPLLLSKNHPHQMRNSLRGTNVFLLNEVGCFYFLSPLEPLEWPCSGLVEAQRWC